MGNWNITIEGGGTHHNVGNQGDAEKLARQLVLDLLNHGHAIRDARFTQRGGMDESLMPRDVTLEPSGYGPGYMRLVTDFKGD